MAKDVLSIMHKLELNPAQTILVGHSMGGMVACELASKNKFAGVVLLGPVHPSPGAAEVFAKRIQAVEEGQYYLDTSFVVVGCILIMYCRSWYGSHGG